MIKSLIRLAILVVIGVLVYNYFMGTPAEKENARAIFQEVKDVGNSIADLIRSEKEKFDAGKYDAALDKVGTMFDHLRSSADQLDGNYQDELSNLEQERDRLEERLRNVDTSEDNPESDQLQEELDSFLQRTRQMIDMIQGE